MNYKEGQWTFNYSDDENWYNEVFDTKEEAIEAGRDYYADDDIEEADYFYIGQIVRPSISINAEGILEDIGENMYDEYGELADSYLYDVTSEHMSELEKSLNTVIRGWMKVYGYEPSFYGIENIEKVYF